MIADFMAEINFPVLDLLCLLDVYNPLTSGQQYH